MDVPLEIVLTVLDGMASVFPSSRMDQNLWKFIGAPECAKFTTGDLMKDVRHFSEAVTLKTDLIEKSGLQNVLLPHVYLFRDIVRDVLSRRYNNLSFLAFAHICVALDYFVTIFDANHDHQPDGLTDDNNVIQRTHKRFKDEINVYKDWKNSQ